jgi:hypothetical protein
LVIFHYDRNHQIILDIPNCLISFDTYHKKDNTSDRSNNPQRRSTCFGFYCLLLSLPAALVSSYIPLQGITAGRTNFVIYRWRTEDGMFKIFGILCSFKLKFIKLLYWQRKFFNPQRYCWMKLITKTYSDHMQHNVLAGI